jgi:hypothetical protein
MTQTRKRDDGSVCEERLPGARTTLRDAGGTDRPRTADGIEGDA